MNITAKIATASALKDEGNAFFKDGNVNKARVKYCTAIAYTKGLPGRTGSGDKMVNMASNNIPGDKVFII